MTPAELELHAEQLEDLIEQISALLDDPNQSPTEVVAEIRDLLDDDDGEQ